jgi:hypothetical protein
MTHPSITGTERDVRADTVAARVNALDDLECRLVLQFLAGLDPWMANVALDATEFMRRPQPGPG